jgi:hypothetical protein
MKDLSRRFRKPFACHPSARVRLTLERLEERTVPTIFTVTNLNDGGPGSLRQAISAANAAADPDVIQFSPGLTGTINLTLLGDDNTNAGGDLDILNPVSIQGPGADLLMVRQTVPNERVFDVLPASGANVSISGLTITGGNGTNGGGGGVQMVGAVTLTLSAVEVTGNSSSFLNGGGGLLQLDSGSLLTIINSTIANNSTGAGLNGGGIRVVNGAAFILNSTISGNTTAAEGGGIIISGSGSATVRNSTIVGNRAPNSLGRGGGIEIASGGSAKLSSTIVAGNIAGFLGDDVDGIVQASSDHNLIGKDTGLMGIPNGVNGNIVGTSAAPIDPRLGPLQLNGGHTRTQALLPGSPAIDKGFAPNEVKSDQRGPLFARTFGPAPDIGAFEVQPNPGPTAQALQTAIQALGILQPSGARLAAFAFGDVSGHSVNDIVLALRLRNGRLLVVSFDGVDGHVLGAFVPFRATLNADARVQLVTLDFSADPGLELGLLVSKGGPGVPRVSVFSERGTRLL